MDAASSSAVPMSGTAPCHAAPPDGDFEVRLEGARTPAIALGLTALLVLGVVELAIGEAHRLAHWWWAPALMVVPVVLLMANALLGARMRGVGDILVVERLLSRHRMAASTISGIHLAGVVDERIEVVRDTGRTWAFTAADTAIEQRRRAVDLANLWLDAHGGPVPVQTGTLHDGERLGFAAGVNDWLQVAVLGSLEVVAAVVCVRDLGRDPGSPLRTGVTVLLLLLVICVMVVLMGRVTWAGTTVHGDALVMRRPLLPPRRIVAADVESMQVTMRNGEPGVRVLVNGHWTDLALHMRPLDHPRALLRLAAWLQLHGAHLTPRDDALRRLDGAATGLFALVVLSFVGMTWLLGAYAHGWGGLWAAGGSMCAPLLVRPRALDPSAIDETRGLAWSFQR